MKRSSKRETGFAMRSLRKKGYDKPQLHTKGSTLDLSYRDIKDWYYGDKYKLKTTVGFINPRMTNEDSEEKSKSPPKKKHFEGSKFDLFTNPGYSSRLVLKKTSKDIRLGYKKIMKKDILYDEMYQEKEDILYDEMYQEKKDILYDEMYQEKEDFLCCKEYRKYIEDLVDSHEKDADTCGNIHKGRLEYLCEVACYELSRKESSRDIEEPDLECVVKSNCPLKFCRDTFCSKCNLCLTSSRRSP